MNAAASRPRRHDTASLSLETGAERWRAENAEAIAASNRCVEENGLPLAASRLF